MKMRVFAITTSLLVLFGASELFSQSGESLKQNKPSEAGKGAKSLQEIRAKMKTQTEPEQEIPPSLPSDPGVIAGGGFGGGLSQLPGLPGGMGMAPPTAPSQEKQKIVSLIQQLRERLKSKKQKREEVETLLRNALSEYFQLDMEERVREFDKVKARVAEMESKLQLRLDRQKDIVELQTLQILHKADGLELVIPNSNGGYGGMGIEGGGDGGFSGAGGFGYGGGPAGYGLPGSMIMGSGGAGYGGGEGGSVGGFNAPASFPNLEIGPERLPDGPVKPDPNKPETRL